MAVHDRRPELRVRRCVWLLAVCMVSHSLACGPPRTLYRPLTVTYLPHLVKGLPEHFPPRRILVLRPIDQRPSLAVRRGTVPQVARGADIAAARQPAPPETVVPDTTYPVVGFRGLNSRGSLFIRNPSRFFPPDLPRLLFYMSDLEETVQKALATHLSEVKLQATSVSFSYPWDRPPTEDLQADYALGCTIEEFVLLSLVYFVQDRGYDFFPALGPTWARVNLKLTLYHWSTGEQLWAGQINETLTDPVAGDNTHIYGTMGDALSVAFSRAIGSLLVTQAVQDILFGP
jgi:hypothetical protein